MKRKRRCGSSRRPEQPTALPTILVTPRDDLTSRSAVRLNLASSPVDVRGAGDSLATICSMAEERVRHSVGRRALDAEVVDLRLR